MQRDESPLYVFERKFGELVPELLKHYNVAALKVCAPRLLVLGCSHGFPNRCSLKTCLKCWEMIDLRFDGLLWDQLARVHHGI